LDETKSLVKALVGLVLIVAAGTFGYARLEGWSLIDGLYMTVITVTTIGYGETHPLSPQGRMFTIALIFGGIGLVGYTFVTFARFVVEGEIVEYFSRRRSMRAIHKIKDHFIVCGFGRMGSFICDRLNESGKGFVVVERDPAVQEKVLQLGYLLSPGEATEEETLKAAGALQARGLVAVLDSDAENVYTVLSARELNPDLEIIARAAHESAKKKLLRAGANRVISPYQIGGMRMLMSILKPNVVTFLEVVMEQKEFNVEVEEVYVAPNSVYAGKELVHTDIRRDLNLIVIAIKRESGELVFNPGPDTMIEGGDTLIAMGNDDMLQTCIRKAATETAPEHVAHAL
jgi:voltage-gated potassium channel